MDQNQENLIEEASSNQNFVNAINTMIGCPVILHATSNDKYHGILGTFTPEFDVFLECCHKIDPKNEVVIFDRSLPHKSQIETMFFEREEIVEISAYDIYKDFAAKSAENIFIDSAITKKTRISSDDLSDNKELVPFMFEESGSSQSNLHSNSLELDDESSAVGWNAEDMLLTNETKYGYKSTYNSNLAEYTLPVEKQDTDEYRRREEEAEKIAFEIESCRSYRKNIDKELSDNEEEEEAFSAVVRTREINNNSTKKNGNMYNSSSNCSGDYYGNSKYYNKRGSFNKQHSKQGLNINAAPFNPVIGNSGTSKKSRNSRRQNVLSF